jgi:hypothetical protein
LVTAQTSPKAIAAVLMTVNAVVAELAEAGGPVNPSWHASLGVLEAWLRGEAKAPALRRAVRTLGRESDKYGVGSPPLEQAAYWLAGAGAKLIGCAADGKNRLPDVLTWTSYAVIGSPKSGAMAHVRDLHAAARKAVAKHDLSPDSIALPARKRSPAGDMALAETLRAVELPIAKLFARKKAERNPKQTASRDELVTLLTKRGYKPHAAVLDFEQRYGGVTLPETGEDDWDAEGTCALLGAWAFLHWSNGSPRGGKGHEKLELVPVVTNASGYCYLDSQGRAYAEDEIEGMMEGVFAKDGDGLVARLALRSFHTSRMASHRFRKLAKASGAKVAKKLGALKVECASSKEEQWWASEDFIVNQSGKDAAACALTDAAFARLKTRRH